MIRRHSQAIRVPVKAQSEESILAQRLREELEKHKAQRRTEQAET